MRVGYMYQCPKWIEKTSQPCCADLAEAFKQVGKGTGNNATITVALGPSRDGEGLPTSRLTIGKYGAIIASQYTAKTHTHTHTPVMTTKVYIYKTFQIKGLI